MFQAIMPSQQPLPQLEDNCLPFRLMLKLDRLQLIQQQMTSMTLLVSICTTNVDMIILAFQCSSSIRQKAV